MATVNPELVDSAGRLGMRNQLAYLITGDVLAIFFVLTGLLKLLPLLKTTEVTNLTSSPLYLWGGIFEVLIGIWWAFEIARNFRFWVTIATLTTFVGLGIYFSISGTTNCGCFGVLQTSPVISLTISSGLLIWLLSIKQFRHEIRKPWQDRMTVGGIIGICFGVAAFGLIDRDGVIDAWANHGVSPSQSEFRFQFAPLGNNQFEQAILVRNFNPRSVSVIGYSRLKGCLDFEFKGLPLNIPAGKTGTFWIQYSLEPTESQMEELTSNFKQALDAGKKIPEVVENELSFKTNAGDDFNITIIQVVDTGQVFRRIRSEE